MEYLDVYVEEKKLIGKMEIDLDSITKSFEAEDLQNALLKEHGHQRLLYEFELSDIKQFVKDLEEINEKLKSESLESNQQRAGK